MGAILLRVVVLLVLPIATFAQVVAVRLPSNPVITVSSSSSLGTNVNGPSVIRVPSWVRAPLGKYYLYFADHRGKRIRLAYAASIQGPWKLHEPGVVDVQATAFQRPQPDPAGPGLPYSHIASPEVWVDTPNQKILMWYHGFWTEGRRWPDKPEAVRPWLRDNAYGQYTQAAESTDGLAFSPLPPITRESYLRVVEYGGMHYGMARLGRLLRARNLRDAFEPGPDPFRGTPYENRLRHVALRKRQDTLWIFFTAIGDSPERILVSTLDLHGDWQQWKAGAPAEVLAPQEKYECADLPVEPSKVGDVETPVRQLRDPAIFEENGKTYLFYSICGEQGIAAAELRFPRR